MSPAHPVTLVDETISSAAEVPRLRRLVTASAAAAGVPGEAVESLELMASELIGNAVVHGQGDVRVVAELDLYGAVRLAVHDLRPGQVVPVEMDLWATGGRGLAIVDLLAYQWGCRSALDGKVVWCETAPSVRGTDHTRR